MAERDRRRNALPNHPAQPNSIRSSSGLGTGWRADRVAEGRQAHSAKTNTGGVLARPARVIRPWGRESSRDRPCGVVIGRKVRRNPGLGGPGSSWSSWWPVGAQGDPQTHTLHFPPPHRHSQEQRELHQTGPGQARRKPVCLTYPPTAEGNPKSDPGHRDTEDVPGPLLNEHRSRNK